MQKIREHMHPEKRATRNIFIALHVHVIPCKYHYKVVHGVTKSGLKLININV